MVGSREQGVGRMGGRKEGGWRKEAGVDRREEAEG